MPQPKRSTAPKRKRSTAPKRKPPAKRSAGRQAVNEPLELLKGSLDAAEAALKDLRAGASKGTRELVRDLEKAVKHLRANTRQVGRAVSKDVAAARSEATKSRPRKAAKSRPRKAAKTSTTTRRKASSGRSK